MVSWTIEDGSSNSEAISNSETLYISGAGSVTTTFNGTTNVMTVSGADYSPISDEGTASSFTFDLDTNNVFSGTLNSATSTLATSNGGLGQRFMVRLKQDGTGNRDVSSWFGGRVSWPGGSAPSLSTGANLVDLFGFLVTSGTAPTLYYDGFTIATGIQ